MRRFSLNRTATYIVSAVVLTTMVWAIAVWTVVGEREQRFADSAAQARRLAVFFERHALAAFRYGDSYLKMVRRDYLEQRSIGAVRELMQEVPLDRSIVSHITIIDETGTPLLVSDHDIKPGTTAADREYFQFQKTHRGDQAYVSLPHRGRNSGKLIVRLVRRMSEPDGRFGGVIFAALEADNITKFFEAMHLGPKSSASLVGTDKRIRARSSYGRLGLGQDISGSRIWRELEQSPVGLYEQTSVVDEITRHYAYRLLPEFPLVVAIGVSTEDISQAVSQFQIPAYAIAVLATVLIATVTVLLSRETSTNEKLANSEARVRSMHDELERRVEERTAELEAVQNELLRKERLAILGQLTGTVAHELRNPLGTITTSTAVMERKAAGAGLELESTAARVQRNVERCNKIITELLDFARAKGLDLQPTRLDDWLAEILNEFHYPKNVVLQRDLGTSHSVVELDRDRIRRAIVNVVENARDAVLSASPSSGQGKILVSTRRVNGKLEVEISDNGPGMSEELMAKIYEPLFSTKTFGVGLGLPVVKQVMEEHGGGFEMSSEEGHGTRVLLWLPASRANAMSA